ncbi:GntR family transcriptional regulator [Streptomyces albus]|uniref:GntR family transcriptional regulator n=1 Tax=Streptomyces physcomitrii TaxID=2724184 RepID=UPI00086355EF|nr:korSA, regulatory protein [Streptomyces albus]AYN33793.1 GntR family transcriptional regulator [Streptomyces albus]
MKAESEDSRSAPRYAQIADEIVQQIRTGVLKPGDTLPSESELMARYGVSGGTVRKAMAEVRVSGLVETRHGKGSTVKNRPVGPRSSHRFRRSHRRDGRAAYLADAMEVEAVPKVELLHVGAVPAPAEIARSLGLEAGSQVLSRQRIYFRDDTPVESAISYLPWDVAKDIPELFAENTGAGGLYARLEEHGHVFAEYIETLEVRGANKAEARDLALTAGSPVIHLVREALTTEGRVVEVCDTLMAADLFVLTYRIPATD